MAAFVPNRLFRRIFILMPLKDTGFSPYITHWKQVRL
jgi:hypothetical protein